MSGFRIATAYAAVLSTLAGTLAPVAYGQPRDAAAALPVDTLAFASWSELAPREGDSLAGALLEALPSLAEQFEADAEVIAQMRRASDIATIVARGDGALALLGFEQAADGSNGRARPALGLVLHAGPDAERLEASIAELGDASENDTIDGVTFRRVASDDGEIYWTRRDGWLLAANGREAAARLLAAAGGDSLANSATLRAARQRVGHSAGTLATLSLFVDAPKLLAAIREVADVSPAADQVLHELGVDALTGIYVHCGEAADGGGFHAWIGAESLDRGLLTLWRQESLSRDDLQVIPVDASWAWVTRLDLRRVYEEVLRIAGALDEEAPAKIQGAAAMAASVTGFSAPDELLPALGDTWVLFDAPDHGGFLFSGTVLVLKPRDGEALRGMFARTLEMAAPFLAQAHIRLEARRVEHDGHIVGYLVAPGAPVGIAPAAAFVGEHVVIGQNPQVVKVALRQLDPALRRGSILDNEQVQRLAGRLSENTISFAFNDAHAGMRTLYPLLHALKMYAASIAASGSAMDPGTLPTLPEVLADTVDGVRLCTVHPDGILYASHGQMFTPGLSAGYIAVVALLISILLPSLARARELAKRAVSGSNLRGLAMGCHIYAADHDEAFPPHLEELVAGGHCTPEQLISPRGNKMIDPEQIRELRASGQLEPGQTRPGTLNTSYIYIAGQSASDDPRNVLMYEELVDDEGTNVLFLDGHVAFVRLPEFRRMLAQTYQRLGREHELPEQFRE